LVSLQVSLLVSSVVLLPRLFVVPSFLVVVLLLLTLSLQALLLVLPSPTILSSPEQDVKELILSTNSSKFKLGLERDTVL